MPDETQVPIGTPAERPPPTSCSAVWKALRRANQIRKVDEQSRYHPEPDLLTLADEVVRLRGILTTIRDYYGGCGYIGAMADDAMSPNDQAEGRSRKEPND